MPHDSYRFTKMHGLGNDFMVIDATKQQHPFDRETVVKLANRHTGVGFDQLLLIKPSTQADFYCQIYNADGSEAEQCGNGLRCIARYIHEHKLATHNELTIETKAGVFPIAISDQDITVTLPPPNALPEPLELETSSPGEHVHLNTLTLGNPHAILKVDGIALAPVATLGEYIATHPHFACGTNVGFMEIVDRHHIKLRTYERGAGETHACGSNACAAAITGMRNGWLASPVTVEFRYGSLLIAWEGEDKPVYMSGPASTVYEGVLTRSP